MLKWLAVLAVEFVLVTGVALRELSPYAVIIPGRLERAFKYRDRMPADSGLNGERLDVEVEPGLTLRGWLLHASGALRGTVVLLHGHGSCKESTFALAKLLAEHGYNSLAYDSRGHGESGGRYCTYGYYEHGDCTRYVDEAERRFGPLGPLAIWGQSLGGAVALQTLAADRRFRCGVIESTFASLRGVVQSDAAHWLHYSWAAPVDDALHRAGEIAHFPAGTISPEKAASEVRCPVLLIHGAADARIPASDGERIFRHLTAPGCEWYSVEGADHGDVWRKGGAEYERRMLDFLARNELP